nr:hypothetical protein [Microbispora rosea]
MWVLSWSIAIRAAILIAASARGWFCGMLGAPVPGADRRLGVEIADRSRRRPGRAGATGDDVFAVIPVATELP